LENGIVECARGFEARALMWLEAAASEFAQETCKYEATSTISRS
jgi:hypothetical protein